METVKSEILDKVRQRHVALDKSFHGWSGNALYTKTNSLIRLESELAQTRDCIRGLETRVSHLQTRQSRPSFPDVKPEVAPKVSTLARLSSKETEKVQTDLRSISHLLSLRRMQLLTDLSSLYRIDYQGKMRTIGGLVIPPITALKRCDQKDEDNIATALGYLAHRVDLACRILNFPLRYTLKPLGSRSLILGVSDAYPLYYKV